MKVALPGHAVCADLPSIRPSPGKPRAEAGIPTVPSMAHQPKNVICHTLGAYVRIHSPPPHPNSLPACMSFREPGTHIPITSVPLPTTPQPGAIRTQAGSSPPSRFLCLLLSAQVPSCLKPSWPPGHRTWPLLWLPGWASTTTRVLVKYRLPVAPDSVIRSSSPCSSLSKSLCGLGNP